VNFRELESLLAVHQMVWYDSDHGTQEMDELMTHRIAFWEVVHTPFYLLYSQEVVALFVVAPYFCRFLQCRSGRFETDF
jgi:hypothetical protein